MEFGSYKRIRRNYRIGILSRADVRKTLALGIEETLIPREKAISVLSGVLSADELDKFMDWLGDSKFMGGTMSKYYYCQ